MGLSKKSILQQVNLKKMALILKIKHDYSVLYHDTAGFTGHQQTNKTSIDNLKNNMTKETISSKSSKRLKSVVNMWTTSVYINQLSSNKTKGSLSNYINLLTLTLPAKQMHDDKFIKRHLFNHFLIKLKRRSNFNAYVWKAEPQKNGNIHFHLLVSCFIHKRLVQTIWNNVLNEFGYIDRFEEIYKHRNPPTTRIEAIKKANNLTAYIGKYMSKKEGARKIEGRYWGCSDNLKLLTENVFYVDTYINAFLERFKLIHGDNVINTDYAVIYKTNMIDFIKQHDRKLFEVMAIDAINNLEHIYSDFSRL